jgi:hypothetical protein
LHCRGLKFSATCKLTKMGSEPEKLVYNILREYKVRVPCDGVRTIARNGI